MVTGILFSCFVAQLLYLSRYNLDVWLGQVIQVRVFHIKCGSDFRLVNNVNNFVFNGLADLSA